jgi:hypothetical protein
MDGTPWLGGTVAVATTGVVGTPVAIGSRAGATSRMVRIQIKAQIASDESANVSQAAMDKGQ